MAATTTVCALALVVTMALGGCASMLQKGPEYIPVNSNPEGARVSLDGVACGSTPCTVSVPRGSEGLLTIEYPGYGKQTRDLEKSVCGWFIGGILTWTLLTGVGGIVSMTVDLLTHSQGKYPEDPVYVELQPLGP